MHSTTTVHQCRYSSAGRASDWRSEGPAFDPRWWQFFFTCSGGKILAQPWRHVLPELTRKFIWHTAVNMADKFHCDESSLVWSFQLWNRIPKSNPTRTETAGITHVKYRNSFHTAMRHGDVVTSFELYIRVLHTGFCIWRICTPGTGLQVPVSQRQQTGKSGKSSLLNYGPGNDHIPSRLWSSTFLTWVSELEPEEERSREIRTHMMRPRAGWIRHTNLV